MKTGALPALVLAVALLGCSKQAGPAPGTGANNPPLIIVPNVSVGQIHSGMTVQQVVTQLGEPQRRTASALEYTRLGFAVLPNSTGQVQVVMCGDVMGLNRPLVQAFSGRTPEGIGMNSSRDELIKAYGEPTQSKKFPGGVEGLSYDPLGITFTLEGGKVYHMIVRLAVPQEVDRTVNLQTQPASPQPTN